MDLMEKEQERCKENMVLEQESGKEEVILELERRIEEVILKKNEIEISTALAKLNMNQKLREWRQQECS